MMEYEKKLLLTEEEYVTLMNHFQKVSSTKQINYYFDTDDLSMNKQGITCRIRYKNGTYKATVKKHKTDIQDCSEETIVGTTSELIEDIFTSMGLKLQGNLVTNRTIILKQNAYMVVLDKNDYLGHTDYELEIEYISSCEKYATQLIWDIASILISNGKLSHIEDFFGRMQNAKSKSQRFFERKTNIKKSAYMPIKMESDNASSIFCSPLPICENCNHWSGSTCDVIKYGCKFIKKL